MQGAGCRVQGSGSRVDLPRLPLFRRSLQLRSRNVKRLRGGFVFKAHGLLYHSTLGLRVIKKKKVDLPRLPLFRSFRLGHRKVRESIVIT